MFRNSVPFKEKMKENLRSRSLKPGKRIPTRPTAKDEQDSENNVVTFSYRRKLKAPHGFLVKNVNIIFNEDAMKVMNVQATETHLPKHSSSGFSAVEKLQKLTSPKRPERKIPDKKEATRQSTTVPTNARRSTQNHSSYNRGSDIDAISTAGPVSERSCVRDNSIICSSLSLLNIIETDNSEQVVGCGHFPITPVSRAESLVNYIPEDELPSISAESPVKHNYSHRLRSATKQSRLPLLDSDGYTSCKYCAINKPINRKRKQLVKKRPKRKAITKKGVKLRTGNEAISTDTIADTIAPSPNVAVIAEVHQNNPLSNSNQGPANSELDTNENVMHNSCFESTSENSEYYAPRRRNHIAKTHNLRNRSYITFMQKSLHAFEQSVGEKVTFHVNQLEQISDERAKIFRTIYDLEQKLSIQRSKFNANMKKAKLCSSDLLDVMAMHIGPYEKLKDQASKNWLELQRISSSDYE